ncbi:helix-hairpin-helix domain-containing protein [candidate division KSB1 bacterium]|nr:helix-hairpin-helix domain-containing protein [candidate division KSB1 bacterium]NIR71348.1 helix-hairpin-helix domain-containing protein [candidate division KSB1 bacterium]NIS26238.1 helix-hairpin-helix domain-containing protein [candidate division KSB1 bacterium]NIT74668.1 helix-hairpin-helix domain-containing protein [candidate division KSB1 bacterium]NIU26886.1 helix-hairpin-helix domain-containing protein [candidate division KSB1 bacterium]
MLGFTKQEQGIVLFLVATLLLGSVVTVYHRFFSQDNPLEGVPNYIQEFEKKAHEINTSLADDSEADEIEQVQAGFVVDSKPESEGAESAASNSSAEDSTDKKQKFLVDVNTASHEQLQNIPRIGPVLAQRIIEHRTRNGFFRSIEELLDVKGIGKATLRKIAPYVRVN